MGTVHRSPWTFAAVALGGVLALAVGAEFAQGKAAGVSFTSAPHRAVQGSAVMISLSVRPAGGLCSLRVRYADGSVQRGLGTRRATGGRATWRWRVPRSARAGRATVTASCAGAGSATRTMTVIGEVLPLKIDVVKTGWSTRVSRTGSTRVSYGVLLANTSKTENAVNVQVLVNFVMADNRLIGSAAGTLLEIRAETQHAYGGEVSFGGAAPIERLEVVVQVRSRAPRTERIPGISAVRIVPDRHFPEWVGSVEGEIANDDQSVIQVTRLSTVVLDGDGNIIGGGRGTAPASLPPAAREFFKITTGVGPIPIDRAVSALVSVEPVYADSLAARG